MSIRTALAAALATALAITGTTTATATPMDTMDTVGTVGIVDAGVDAGVAHGDDEVLLDDAALETLAGGILADAFGDTDTDAHLVDNGRVADSDNDGIPDAWETHGVTLSDGTFLDLPAWGANPDKKDLFLQLNWMRSEFTTLSCHTTTDTNAQACQNANTKSYRPTEDTLDQLVDLFADHDIALHIDAGATYTTMDNYPTLHGGETLDHTNYAFNGQNALTALTNYQKDLLGARAAVFHVGVIGDQMAPRDYSTGQGMVHGNAFYVANHNRMRTQEELRNTILHELGHNLGLRHNGHNDHVKGLDNTRMHPDYHSVMNYTYQLNPNNFDYSTRPYTRTDNGHTREIPADWDTLTLTTYTKATGNHTPGNTTNADIRKAIEETNNAKTAARAAAARNRTATLTTTHTPTNVHPGETITLSYQLENPGIDTTTYTIDATYPGGTTTNTITLDGALTGNNTTTIDITITAADLPTMPIDITITTQGQTVAHTTEHITTTATTNLQGATNVQTEATNVQAETEKTEATNTETENTDATNTEAEKTDATNTEATKAEVATKATKATADNGVNIAAIIVPIVIALIAAIGAGFAMMNN